MSGKPAARVTDPTACPLPGHGTNPITAGSPDVQFDGLPAARQNDPTACGSTLAANVIPNVLINGLPATTLGTLGSHGNVVVGGSGSVIIGNSHAPAPFTPPAALAVAAAAVQALLPRTPSLPQGPTDTLARNWQEEPGDPAPQGLEEEEEEEELEEPAQQGITLRIGVFFDGTGNNSSNSEVGNQCRAAALNIGEQESQAIYQRCKSYQLDPDSSYGNDVSNIWRLYSLYREDAQAAFEGDEPKAYLRTYVTGIGTTTGEKDTLLPGQAFGQGATGVLAKVDEGFLVLEKALVSFADENSEAHLAKLELDIFGFSRGAAAARHFANQILKRKQGPLGKLLLGQVPQVAGFNWQRDIAINFIGLFDTVAAIGSWEDWGNPADAHNGNVDLYLAPDAARQVVHLVARDEFRRNFALNRVAAPHREITLPGAHSDLGGGYQPEAMERLYPIRPRSNWVSRDTRAESTPAYRNAVHDTRYVRELDLLDPQDPAAKLSTHLWEHFQPFSGGRDDQMKHVLAAPLIERRVYGHLSRVYLRVMHRLALEAGVPLNRIQEKDPTLALPDELKIISEKLLAWAISGTGALDKEEERLLRQRYIHLSTNWNASAGSGGSALDVVFINAPAERERARYADRPKGNRK